MTSPLLVTGAAGFIGFHTSQALLKKGISVVGIDNLNAYYDISLKEKRLEILSAYPNFTFIKADIADKEAIQKIWQTYVFTKVIHLAAQAGVRYSLEDPYTYVNTNVMGHLILLECARHTPHFEHLVYASTSSVYGNTKKLPFSVEEPTESPLSVYAATKKMDELLSSVYTHLFQIPLTGLRFFTVYGPWGRPDMSALIFAKKMLAGESIPVFNNGNMARDYTYIDDIVSGILGALIHVPRSPEGAPLHKIYNLGNNKKESLLHFIELIEKTLGISAKKEFLPMHKADVPETCADISSSTQDFGYIPKTSLEEGIQKLLSWYKEYYIEKPRQNP